MSKIEPLSTIAIKLAKERNVESIIIAETTGVGFHIKTGLRASPYHQITSGMMLIHNALSLVEELDSMDELNTYFDSGTLESLMQVHGFLSKQGVTKHTIREMPQ